MRIARESSLNQPLNFRACVGQCVCESDWTGRSDLFISNNCHIWLPLAAGLWAMACFISLYGIVIAVLSIRRQCQVTSTQAHVSHIHASSDDTTAAGSSRSRGSAGSSASDAEQQALSNPVSSAEYVPSPSNARYITATEKAKKRKERGFWQ